MRDRDGKPIPFGQVSPMSQVLARQLMFRRLHIAPQWRDQFWRSRLIVAALLLVLAATGLVTTLLGPGYQLLASVILP